MNLQQLNESGQNVWVFVITAVLALLLTSAVWMAIVIYREYRQWRDQMKASPEDDWAKRGRQYSFVIRAAILSLILKEGYIRWLWISGAWIRILTNERIKSDRADKLKAQLRTGDDIIKNEARLNFRDQTACDYVCQHIRRKTREHYFSIDPYRDDREKF